LYQLNESTLRIIVDASPNAQILINNEGKIEYINQFSEKLFMYTSDEVLGKDLSALIPVKHLTTHSENLDTYFRNPLSRIMAENLDPHGLKKDGTIFPLEITLNPMITESEKFVLASIIDISRRINSIEEKRKTDEKFKLLVESAPNAIYY